MSLITKKVFSQRKKSAVAAPRKVDFPIKQAVIMPGNVKASVYVKASVQRRRKCQDRAVVVPLTESKMDIVPYLMAVFDGHGKDGGEIAQVCVQQLEEENYSQKKLKATLKNSKNYLTSLVTTLHKRVCKTFPAGAKDSGSTATIALVNGNEFHIAWVGDSKAIILTTNSYHYKEFEPFDLVKPHDNTTPEETQRLKNGGYIEQDITAPYNKVIYCKATGSGLEMSKSIGDLYIHNVGGSAEADYNSLYLNAVSDCFKPKKTTLDVSRSVRSGAEYNIGHCVVIIASDGIWNVMSNEQVAKCVNDYYAKDNQAESLSEVLTMEAYSRYTKARKSDDDISVIAYSPF